MNKQINHLSHLRLERTVAKTILENLKNKKLSEISDLSNIFLKCFDQICILSNALCTYNHHLKIMYTKTKFQSVTLHFTPVQKVKHRVYKIHAFFNEAILCRDCKLFHLKLRVLLVQTKFEKRYLHFKKSHLFYDINNNKEPLSINVFVCLKMLLATVI